MENDSSILLQNLDRIHTTEMGIQRIQRNLDVRVPDIVTWCKSKIADTNCVISKKGKNWYGHIDGIILTINAHSYTIITAHKLKIQ